jgi:FkbM family methyltransferase
LGCLVAESGFFSPTDYAISGEDRLFIEAFPWDQYHICNVPRQGLFCIDTTADVIKETLSRGFSWEASTDDIIRKYVVPGTIVLDIGAHIGTHTVTMSRAVGNKGVVIAFEPQKKIFRELYKNLEINRCFNVKPVHGALGAEEKVAFMGTPEPNNEGGRSVEDSGPEKVLMRTLDSYNLSNVSFIKMDVENFEDEVLKGASNTLLKNRPILFLEIQGNWVVVSRRGVNRAEKIRGTILKLEKLGYQVSLFSGDDYIAIPVGKK